MFGIGWDELLLILMILIIFIAANRLPEVGRSLADALREQRRREEMPPTKEKDKTQ